MRAIVLAAGKGNRISDKINYIPKSLLQINGKTIIETIVDKLLSRNIMVTVCVGYRHLMIEEALKGKLVEFLYNPFYALTNNIGTLWFARNVFNQDDDVMILSADLIFDMSILERIEQVEGDLVMGTDSSRIKDGDYFFSLNSDGKLVEYGPDVQIQDRTCEYMGISLVKRQTCKLFCERLEKMIENGEFQSYFEQVFFSFKDSSDVRLRTADVAGLSWREIDYFKDYKKALGQFQ